MLKDVVYRSKPKLVFVTESHLKSIELESNYKISGYNVENCLSSSSYTGGCSIYVKNNVSYKVILNECQGLNWILGVKIFRGYEQGLYSVIYHSPSTSDNDFCDILNNKWLPIIYDKKLSLVLGDFNINWLDKKNSKILKNIMLQSRGFSLIKVSVNLR